MERAVVVGLALVASVGGLLLAAAHRLGAPTVECRDTVDGGVAMCVAPGAPAWVLLLASLPGPAVVVLAAALLRQVARRHPPRRRRTVTGRPDVSPV